MKQKLFTTFFAVTILLSPEIVAGNTNSTTSNSNSGNTGTPSTKSGSTSFPEIRKNKPTSSARLAPSRLRVDCVISGGMVTLMPNFGYAFNNVTITDLETGEVINAFLTPDNESFYIGQCGSILEIQCEIDGEHEFSGDLTL